MASTGPRFNIRNVKRFLVAKNATITDIVALDEDLLLVVNNKTFTLQLHNTQGFCLSKYDIEKRCRIASGHNSTVLALLPEANFVQIFKVADQHIMPQALVGLHGDKNYTCVVLVDEDRIGVSFDKPYNGIDIIPVEGVHLPRHSIKTSVCVSHMCKAEDGFILCSSESERTISKIDVNSGLEIFSCKVPQIPRLCGIAYSEKNQTILACGGKEGTLSLLNKDGQFDKQLWHSKSTGVYIVSVNGDICMWEGRNNIYWGKLHF